MMIPNDQLLPKIEVFDFCEPDDGEKMELHLLYQGPLRSEGGSDNRPYGRARDKHELRKCFHPQLREFWKTHPQLKVQSNKYFRREEEPGGFVYHPAHDNRESREIPDGHAKSPTYGHLKIPH